MFKSPSILPQNPDTANASAKIHSVDGLQAQAAKGLADTKKYKRLTKNGRKQAAKKARRAELDANRPARADDVISGRVITFWIDDDSSWDWVLQVNRDGQVLDAMGFDVRVADTRTGAK